jgi:uncharacterized membrane protein YkoI
MNKRNQLSVIAGAALSALLLAAPAMAGNDIGPDQAVKLLQAGTIKSFEELNQIAMAKHPGATIGDTELEKEHGNYIYEVELRDAQGVEWDLDINAATGEVLSDRRDD